MLIISFDDLTAEDLAKYSFEFEKEKIIRFCIDISHSLLCFGSPREDHIKQGEMLLNREENLDDLNEEQIAEKLLNHIIGGSIFPDLNKAFILIGGSSIEQGLNLKLKKFHSQQTFVLAKDSIEKIFKKFYPNLKVKINPK